MIKRVPLVIALLSCGGCTGIGDKPITAIPGWMIVVPSVFAVIFLGGVVSTCGKILDTLRDIELRLAERFPTDAEIDSEVRDEIDGIGRKDPPQRKKEPWEL